MEACSAFLFVACTLKRGAIAGFCFVSALAVVQAWLVASEIAKARSVRQHSKSMLSGSSGDVSRCFPRWTVCDRGGPSPGIDWGKLGGTGRFATVILGGVVFSTIAALTLLPVVIARIFE